MSEWQKVKIGDLITQYKDIEQISATKEYKQVTVSNTGEIRLRNMEKGSNIKAKTGMIVEKGTFIYSRLSVHNGAFGIIPDELSGAIVTNEMPVFKFDDSKIIPDFFLYLLKTGDVQFQLKLLTKGVGRVRIKEKNFLNIEVLVPDIDTQRVLTGQILENNKKFIAFKAQNSLQRSHLALLRQQILQDAISGKLTEGWRAENPDTEPANKLLEQIKAEKAKLIAEKKIKKEKPLSKIVESEIPFELPVGWEWCRLGEITRLVTDGKHGDCNNDPNSGFYFLSAKDVQNGKLIYENARQILENDFQEVHRRTDLEAGDICMVNTGATIGKMAIAEDTPLTPKTTFQKSVAVIKLIRSGILNKIAELALLSFTKNLLKTSKGSAINNLLLGDLKKMPFPLPPRAEQRAIVAKVERLMGYVSQLEEKIAQNANSAETLMQAFLGEVFRK